MDIGPQLKINKNYLLFFKGEKLARLHIFKFYYIGIIFKKIFNTTLFETFFVLGLNIQLFKQIISDIQELYTYQMLTLCV